MAGNYSPKAIFNRPDFSRARSVEELARMVGQALGDYGQRTIGEFKRVAGAGVGTEGPIIIQSGSGGGSSGSVSAGGAEIRWNDLIAVAVVGDFTVPFDRAMPDNKYSLYIKCLKPNGNIIQHQEKAKTANDFTIYVPQQPYTISFHAVKTL